MFFTKFVTIILKKVLCNLSQTPIYVFFLHIFELRFTRCNAEQQIQGIELQEKEVPKD